MHFILYVRVWLHQGVPIEQSLQQGYGRCRRMTRGHSQNPGETTPSPEDVADSSGDAGQRKTRSQSRGASPSGSVQSITTTIDNVSLVTAMSRMNDSSAGNLDKGVQPRWDFKGAPWTDFQHKVEIWATSHDIAHLLERDPYPSEQKKHDTAIRTVLLNFKVHDRAYVRNQHMLHDVWSMLNGKNMPSVAAEATKLWIQFEGLRQRRRPMQEHVNECMTVRNKLLAINERVPDRQFIHKLLNVDKELFHVRATLAHANIDAIVSGPTDAYAFMHINDPPRQQHQESQRGRGRFQRRFPRGSGAPQGAGVAAMAAARVQRLFKRAGSAAQGSGAGSSILARLLDRGDGFWSICASQHAIEGRNILLTTLSQQTCHRVHCQCLDQARSCRAMRRHPAMYAESCLGAALCQR